MIVGGDAGLVEAQVVRVWTAAYGEQDMAADDLGRALGAVDAGDDALGMASETDALGVGADSDLFGLQDRMD